MKEKGKKGGLSNLIFRIRKKEGVHLREGVRKRREGTCSIPPSFT